MQQPPNPEYPPAQQPTQTPYQYGNYPPPPQYPHLPPADPRLAQSNYPPQQPIKPRKSRTWLWIIGLILAFLVGRASVTTASSTADATPQTSTSNTTTNQQQVVQPTQAPTKPLTWTTVQSFSGNGEKKTAVFSVPNDWKVNWTCNPSSFGGNSYNVIVTVYTSDGTLSDVAINSMCKSGTTSGTTEEHQAGSVYLDISSEGDWSVTIQELK